MRRKDSSSGKNSASTKVLRAFGPPPPRPTLAVWIGASLPTPVSSVADQMSLLSSLFLASSRGAHHASALLALIERFPRRNPRPDEDGVDMSAQLRLIRSRYKAMCASFGVRARLQSSSAVAVDNGPGLTEGTTGGQSIGADMGAKKKGQAVWELSGPPTSASAHGLSF